MTAHHDDLLRSPGFALAAATIAVLAALAGAPAAVASLPGFQVTTQIDTVYSLCSPVDIWYTFNHKDCTLKRVAHVTEIAGTRCIDMPGYRQEECKFGFTGGYQTGISGVTADANGTVRIYQCTNGKCDSSQVITCQITYYKAAGAKQPQVPGDQSDGGVDDPNDVPRLRHRTRWDGANVEYLVQNLSGQVVLANWPGTPILNVQLGPGSQVLRTRPSPTAPHAELRSLHFAEPATGVEIDLQQVVTYLPNVVVDGPGWSPLAAAAAALALGAAGIFVVRRRAARTA